MKAAQVVASIRKAHPGADISFEPIELASLSSIAAGAERISKSVPRIDLLINNAGVMAIPTPFVTADRFEMQFGVNHLGHFALTLHLLPKILSSSSARVVTLSSVAHRSGRINFDDLQAEKRYSPWAAYCQSKLANLMFSMELELERRARAEGWPLISNAAHPGFARTGLQSVGPRMGRGDRPAPMERLGAWLGAFLSQSAAAGALPTLYAATSPDAVGGVLYGPDGFYEMKGSPHQAKIARRALDQTTWRRLWDVSQQLTSVTLARPIAA
jgi:NAD(P)-dependent dehydrogenase (short-subunit alcohol dehydrogenase family)